MFGNCKFFNPVRKDLLEDVCEFTVDKQHSKKKSDFIPTPLRCPRAMSSFGETASSHAHLVYTSSHFLLKTIKKWKNKKRESYNDSELTNNGFNMIWLILFHLTLGQQLTCWNEDDTGTVVDFMHYSLYGLFRTRMSLFRNKIEFLARN